MQTIFLPCRQVDGAETAPSAAIGIEAIRSRLASGSSSTMAGPDAMSAVPLDRWDADGLPEAVVSGRFGGFVADWAGFDAAAFAISPSEAVLMDPQQRVLLEASRLSPAQSHPTVACVVLAWTW